MTLEAFFVYICASFSKIFNTDGRKQPAHFNKKLVGR
jgi:hypothetical protein